jgi:glutamine amidotransferase
MRGGGSVNADGFGLGWYGDEAAPVRYRRSVPIWADESLPGLARSIHSGAVLAAVRNGTVGSPLTESAVAPFVRDQWLFSHNGLISGWPGSISKLAEALPVSELLTLDAPMDSALLWALIQDRLYSGSPPAEAVASVVREVAAAAPESRLNVLLTDGEQLVATTWTHSLWVRRTTDSVAVSSEPWTSDGWEAVPDHSLLLATSTTLAITPLDTSNPSLPDTPFAPGPEQPPMEGRQ